MIELWAEHRAGIVPTHVSSLTLGKGKEMNLRLIGIIIALCFIITPMIFGVWGFIIYTLCIALMGAYLFAAWQLAKANIFFTFVGTGKIKTVDRGRDNLVRVLENVSDHHLDDHWHIVSGENLKSLLEREYGLYWVGLPPSTTHRFSFVHERVNPDINDDTPSSEWIIRDAQAKETDELFWEVPHTYRITGVELSDGFHVDLLFNTRSRVVVPETALYIRGGQFIDYMAQYVESGVNAVLCNFDAVTLRTTDKSEGSQITIDIIRAINESTSNNPNFPAQPLLEAVGMKVVGGFISRIQSSDKSEEEALRKKKKAILDGEAAVETAKLEVKKAAEEATRITTLAKAQADADGLRAVGQVSGLTAAMEAIKLKFPDIDDATALAEAGALARTIKLSDKDSPVTVIGAGVNIGVNNPGKKG